MAAALVVGALAPNRLLSTDAEGGWSMYAPNSELLPFSTSSADGETLRGGAIWFTAIAVWLVRSRPNTTTSAGSVDLVVHHWGQPWASGEAPLASAASNMPLNSVNRPEITSR